jgi:hypothetical protein
VWDSRIESIKPVVIVWMPQIRPASRPPRPVARKCSTVEPFGAFVSSTELLYDAWSAWRLKSPVFPRFHPLSACGPCAAVLRQRHAMAFAPLRPHSAPARILRWAGARGSSAVGRRADQPREPLSSAMPPRILGLRRQSWRNLRRNGRWKICENGSVVPRGMVAFQANFVPCGYLSTIIDSHIMGEANE